MHRPPPPPPALQALLRNPELLRTMMQANPAVRQMMESNPEVRPRPLVLLPLRLGRAEQVAPRSRRRVHSAGIGSRQPHPLGCSALLHTQQQPVLGAVLGQRRATEQLPLRSGYPACTGAGRACPAPA